MASTKLIRVLHPIEHNGRRYERGDHEVEASLAEHFLGLRDAISKAPIAVAGDKRRLPRQSNEEASGA